MKLKFNLFKKKEKKEKTGGAKEIIAKLSRGLMLPIAMLPIAGLFLGIGNAITTNSVSEAAKTFGQVISTPGNIIFANLAVLFAVAIAITFTGDIGVAGLSSFVGWIVFCAIQNALIITQTDPDTHKVISCNFLFYHLNSEMYGAIFTDNVGIKSLCTSVFGGLTVGFVTAFLYNKFKNIQLPTILGFFSGVRFIPIVTFLSMIPLTFLFSLIWPGFGMGLYYFGQVLGGLAGYGGINAFFNDFVSRSLNPFGLHHAFYTQFWYTPIGGTVPLANNFNFIYNGIAYSSVAVNGVTISNPTWFALAQALGYTGNNESIVGDQKIWIFFSQIAGNKITLDPAGANITITLTFENLSNQFKGVFAGQYMEGRYSIMIFALPAAAAAMLATVPKGHNRKVAGSIIISAALTSFLTGITEPIEFTFLFLAPWLYWGFHSVMCGVSAMLMVVCHAHMGMTFSGGIIDFFIYGVLPDASGAGANCYWAIILGLGFAVLYFFMFYWAIKHFDIKTPGRDQNASVIKLYTKKDYLAKKEGKYVESDPMLALAAALIDAYGGKSNIVNVDACITKLRIQVVDKNKANKQRIIELGAAGVVYPSNTSVYAVFGTKADVLKNKIKDILSGKVAAPEISVEPTKPQAQQKVEIKSTGGKVVICAPANGEVVSTKKVKDDTFSQDIMGKGFAIIPKDGEFVAPIDGEVTLLDKHAFAIKTSNGVEVLVHIGIDTVKLNGKPFKHFTKVGKKVKVGDKIVQADLNMINKNKLNTITPVIALNETIGNRKLSNIKLGNTKSKQSVLTIQ